MSTPLNIANLSMIITSINPSRYVNSIWQRVYWYCNENSTYCIYVWTRPAEFKNNVCVCVTFLKKARCHLSRLFFGNADGAPAITFTSSRGTAYFFAHNEHSNGVCALSLYNTTCIIFLLFLFFFLYIYTSSSFFKTIM